MSVSPARAAAFDILLRIEREAAFSSVLLPMYEERLSVADRGLCHELVLGGLRRQIKLDRVIDELASGKRLDPEVRIALRLGLFQLVHLDRVPFRAAINESVELVKRAKKASAAGLVNAILRRATRETCRLAFSDETERIAVETSHPRWLIERWISRIGIEDAERLAMANNAPAEIAFRVVGESTPAVEQAIRSARPSETVPGCFLRDRITPELRDLSSKNRVYLQDEASQLVAHAVTLPENGTFLDVCAAPGGKTGLVASLAPRSISVGGDIHRARVELLRENCRRQSVSVSVVRYDAADALPFGDQTFDAVLVDAPCSGTGTIRHNPEIRYSLSPQDLEGLSSKQRRILAEASKTVRKGGLLVYSTCSLEVEEGESVADAFAESNRAFARESPKVPEHLIRADGTARTWPHVDMMDGFFIAAFRRL